VRVECAWTCLKSNDRAVQNWYPGNEDWVAFFLQFSQQQEESVKKNAENHGRRGETGSASGLGIIHVAYTAIQFGGTFIAGLWYGRLRNKKSMFQLK
jgi:hypothetical protein